MLDLTSLKFKATIAEDRCEEGRPSMWNSSIFKGYIHIGCPNLNFYCYILQIYIRQQQGKEIDRAAVKAELGKPKKNDRYIDLGQILGNIDHNKIPNTLGKGKYLTSPILRSPQISVLQLSNKRFIISSAV